MDNIEARIAEIEQRLKELEYLVSQIEQHTSLGNQQLLLLVQGKGI